MCYDVSLHMKGAVSVGISICLYVVLSRLESDKSDGILNMQEVAGLRLYHMISMQVLGTLQQNPSGPQSAQTLLQTLERLDRHPNLEQALPRHH